MQKIMLEKSAKYSASNHVFVVDVSGSMYDSLPKMRQHLKNNITTMVKDGDTLSIIYFSGTSQHGVILEAATVNNVAELENVKSSIDKYLQTIGLTGFVGPLKDSIEIAKKLNGSNNLVFMTDGYDNCSSKTEILKLTSELSKYYENISFIEYGYYCDRALLASMADTCSGNHIFSEDYTNYESVIETAIKDSVKKQEVQVTGEYVIYTRGGSITKLKVNNNVVNVPIDLDYIITFNEDEDFSNYDDDTKYLVLYTSVLGSNVELAWRVLKDLGDVQVVNKLSSCFSKQDFSELQELVKDMVFDTSKRYAEGKDLNAVPKPDAYTVIDLIETLVDGDNYVVLDDESFSYSRIGKAVKQETVQEKIAKLQESMTKTTDVSELQEIARKITEVQDNVQFTPNESTANISNIVFNESRANISINTNRSGYVAISESNRAKYGLPEKVNTSIFRNYTIVKDGIKNVKVLPVYLDKSTFAELLSNNVVEGSYDRNKVYKIDMLKVPLINLNMINSASAVDFFSAKFESEKIAARIKVYKYFMKERMTTKAFSNEFSDEANLYLESVGVKNGSFSPKVTAEKPNDFYMSKELNIKISGLSSLPSIASTIAKRTSGKKINLADTLIIEAIDEHDANIKFIETLKDNTAIEDYYTAILKQLNRELKQYRRTFNSILYSILIGKVWFKEFNSYEENSLEFDYKGISYIVSAVLEEKEVKL